MALALIKQRKKQNGTDEQLGTGVVPRSSGTPSHALPSMMLLPLMIISFEINRVVLLIQLFKSLSPHSDY